MVNDAKKAKRPRSAAALDASREPKPKKAKVAKATEASTPASAAAQAAAQSATSRQVAKTKKSSAPAPAAAQAVPAAAEAATSREAAELKALIARLRKPNGLVMNDRELDDVCTKLGLPVGKNKLTKVNLVRKYIAKERLPDEPTAKKAKVAKATESSTPAPAAAQAVPAAAEAATSREAAELKALIARLRKPNGLVMNDRELDDVCTKLGLPVGKNKLTKANLVRKCIAKIAVACEDDFIQERVSQEAAALEERRQAKKKPVKLARRAEGDHKKPVKIAAVGPTAVGAATTAAEANKTARRTIKERRTIDTAPDANISAWFPVPDYSCAPDDRVAKKNVARHQARFSHADFLEYYGESRPPDFREGLGPFADLLREVGSDFAFQIPGPPVDESEGITLGAPSEQE